MNRHAGSPRQPRTRRRIAVGHSRARATVRRRTGTTRVLRVRFSGAMFYNYYRDYDPTVGRYIESDPIGLAGGNNPYQYVTSNPLRYVDPFGLDPRCGAGWRAVLDPSNPGGNIYRCLRDPSEDPRKRICANAECAAGLLPNPIYSPEEECRMVCNVVASPICTGAAIAAGGVTTVGGAAAWVGCQGGKSVVCRMVCDDEDKKCP